MRGRSDARTGRTRGIRPVVALAACAALLAAAPWGAGEPVPGAQPPGTPGGPGTPSLHNDSASFGGTYVSGDLPPADAILANFTVTSIGVLREVAVSGFVRASVTAVQGTVTVRSAGAELRIVDSLAAYLTVYVNENASVQVSPAPGASFSPDPGGGFRVTAGTLHGLLWASCTTSRLELSGPSAVLASATRGCALHFRADTSFDVLRGDEIAHAVASSSLGAEVSVSEVGGDASPSIQRYAEMEVAVTVADHHVVIAVSAALTTGKAVLVILPRAALDADAAIAALYDGRPLGLAASAADALNATNDGGVAEYYVSSSGDLTAIVVSVPSFSAHLAEFSGPSASAAPSGAGASGADLLAASAVGVGLTAGAGAALFRPRRRG